MSLNKPGHYLHIMQSLQEWQKQKTLSAICTRVFKRHFRHATGPDLKICGPKYKDTKRGVLYVYHAMIFSKRGSTSRGLTFRHDIF
jgi:hypothetical protein